MEKRWRNIKDFILSYRYSYGKNYLVSFPKTGRTWLTHMLSKINEMSSDIIDIESTHDLSEIVLEDGFRQDPTILFKFNNRFRFRRSRVLFLVRDPRDVIVSHYHQVTKRSKSPLIFESMSDFIQDELLGFNRIIYFYNLWANQRHIPGSFYLIKYENLLSDGISELNSICKFLDVHIDDSLIHKIYNESSAEKMRLKELSNELDNFNDFGKERNYLKVRNAKIGGYRDELDDVDIQYCNDQLLNLDPYFNYNS